MSTTEQLQPPVSAAELGNFAQELHRQNRLTDLLARGLDLIEDHQKHGTLGGGDSQTGKAEQQILSDFPELRSKWLDTSSFVEWTEAQRGKQFDDVAEAIEKYAQKASSRTDPSTYSWASDAEILSLLQNSAVTKYLENGTEAASVAFILLLLGILLLLLLLCLLICVA